MVDLRIGDDLESFGNVWVHIQDPGTTPTTSYRARIAKNSLDFVFDATDKDTAASWEEYLCDETRELGSAMLSCYFAKMSQIAVAIEGGYRWVIATLDTVIEDDDGIELRGRAIRFDSSKFVQ
jgi:hypothetical protein